jgi:hypothetical protein
LKTKINIILYAHFDNWLKGKEEINIELMTDQNYPTLFILEPQLGHAVSLCSFPQLIQ